MKIAALIARYLLGIMFVIFGLNGFLHFIPMKGPEMTGPAMEFNHALSSTPYMSVVFAIQLIAGVLFLSGQYIPLALTILAPVLVNIILFHAFMAPSGIVPGLVATVLWFLVFASYRDAFAGILQRTYVPVEPRSTVR